MGVFTREISRPWSRPLLPLVPALGQGNAVPQPIRLPCSLVTATYLETAGRCRTAARHVDDAISQTARIDAAVTKPEIQSHKLWQGAPIYQPAYLYLNSRRCGGQS